MVKNVKGVTDTIAEDMVALSNTLADEVLALKKNLLEEPLETKEIDQDLWVPGQRSHIDSLKSEKHVKGMEPEIMLERKAWLKDKIVEVHSKNSRVQQVKAE
ncbi:hypothetical protein AKO1_006736 [Acrasis kona]